MESTLQITGEGIGHWARRGLGQGLARAWALVGRCWRSRPPRQLRLRETLALGERRFVAVIEFEEQRFLIGGTQSSMTLLAEMAQSRGAAGSASSDIEGAGRQGEGGE